MADSKPKEGTDWIRLASSGPAVLGFLGLIVYAVVRIGHDAFYAKFGVTAEEVGLSQTTILGRAALYFVFFLTAALALLGVSVLIARSAAALGAANRKRSHRRSDREGRMSWARAGVSLLVVIACLGVGGLIVAGFQGAWLLATAIAIVVPLTIAAAIGARLTNGNRAAAVAFFALLAAWSASVGFLVANRGIESRPGAESFSASTRWLLFGLCVLAITIASVSLLRQFEIVEIEDEDDSVQSQRRQIYLTILTLLALLPLALAFFAPGVGRFVTEANNRTIAAFTMWLVLFGFVILGFQVLRGRSPDERPSIFDILLIISLVSIFAVTAFYLASVRGLDLANQALDGNRITQSGFGMFSVRSDIVCLLPVTPDPETNLPDSPMIYLGESPNNMLVLFDLERQETIRLREDLSGTDIGAPERVPVLIPAGDAIVQVARLITPSAKYIVPVRKQPGKWEC